MTLPQAPASAPRLLVIYDGACPFCSGYLQWLRLRESLQAELLSARSDDPRIGYYRQQGHRFDEGMLAVLDGVAYAGPEAMQLLAACSGTDAWRNRLNAAIFSRRWLARLLYPSLRLGRRAWLSLRGIPLIDEPVRTASRSK